MLNGSHTGKKVCKFISLHIPKTGGTVFYRHVLIQSFSSVRTDYRSHPLIDKPPRKCEWDILHGHFPASRYKYKELPYITWLRCPIDRVTSHYNWAIKRRYVPFDEFIEKQTNRMSMYMDIDREEFLFVGILERWIASIKLLARVANVNLDRYVSNEFLDSVSNRYRKDNRKYIYPDKSQIKKIKDLNQLDIELYNRECDRLRKEVNNETIGNRPLCE